jgi:hypothetical protein
MDLAHDMRQWLLNNTPAEDTLGTEGKANAELLPKVADMVNAPNALPAERPVSGNGTEEGSMKTPGERNNDATLRALNLALAEKQTALDGLMREVHTLEMAAARAKVEVRFIHYCQQNEPGLLSKSKERLAELETELQGLATSLNYRMAQAVSAERQMVAFRRFAAQFQDELPENLQVRTGESENGPQGDARAA